MGNIDRSADLILFPDWIWRIQVLPPVRHHLYSEHAAAKCCLCAYYCVTTGVFHWMLFSKIWVVIVVCALAITWRNAQRHQTDYSIRSRASLRLYRSFAVSISVFLQGEQMNNSSAGVPLPSSAELPFLRDSRGDQRQTMINIRPRSVNLALVRDIGRRVRCDAVITTINTRIFCHRRESWTGQSRQIFFMECWSSAEDAKPPCRFSGVSQFSDGFWIPRIELAFWVFWYTKAPTRISDVFGKTRFFLFS